MLAGGESFPHAPGGWSSSGGGSADSLEAGGAFLSQRAVFAASASVDPVGDGMRVEQRLLELSETLSLSTEQVEASVTFTARDSDSTEVFLRSGGVEARWPGTPWIGVELSRSISAPFVPGMRDPVLDRGWVDIDSISSVGASLGGLLGTSLALTGFLLPREDTLTVFEASSPWLGFGSFGYSSVSLAGGDSSLDMDVYNARIDLRVIEPWVALVRSGKGADSTAVMLEGIGYTPVSGEWGALELVPVFRWAGDSVVSPGGTIPRGQTVFGLDAILRPRGRALSGAVGCRYDPADPGAASGAFSADLTSEGGFHHSLSVNGIGSRGFRASAASVLHRERASMGGGLEMMSDSLRISGIAGYSPAPGVHAVLEVSATPVIWDGDIPEPRESLSAVFARNGVTAALKLQRQSGETRIIASACAVFP